jgi:hypothetical protein
MAAIAIYGMLHLELYGILQPRHIAASIQTNYVQSSSAFIHKLSDFVVRVLLFQLFHADWLLFVCESFQ